MPNSNPETPTAATPRSRPRTLTQVPKETPAAAAPPPPSQEPAAPCPRSARPDPPAGNPGTGTYQLLGFRPALYLARIPRNDRGGFPAEQCRSAPGRAGARDGGAAGGRRYLYALYLWMARFTLRS